MDVFKRELAPITETAWQEIDSLVKRTLQAHLSARKFVDVSEPRGWDFPGIPLGRIGAVESSKSERVEYGIRQIQPMVETRVSFELNIWELDNLSRGAKDIDLDAAQRAAKDAALFEERTIYSGLKKANIQGLEKAARNALVLPENVDDWLKIISEAISLLTENSVDGSYALILNPPGWRALAECSRGYPLRKQIKELLNGPIIYSISSPCGFLVSMRGGDFELILGQDYTLGYETHNSKMVRLYLTELFTFQIYDPLALVKFDLK
ncbi:MAG: family 1 encapsulin nanocompartment shell protein [Calditrichia bacterium]